MKRNRGFTVIECLVALGLFLLLATVIASGYVNVLKAYQNANRYGGKTDRLAFARRQLLAEPDREAAEKGAEYEDGKVRVSWKAEITPSTMPDLYAVAFSCDLSKTEDSDETHAVEHFLLLRPTWSKPEERGPLETKARQRIQEITTNLAGPGGPSK